MEEYYKIFNLTKGKEEESNNYQIYLRNDKRIKTKIKVISVKQKKPKYIKINQSNNAKDVNNEISLTTKTPTKIKRNFILLCLKTKVNFLIVKNF